MEIIAQDIYYIQSLLYLINKTKFGFLNYLCQLSHSTLLIPKERPVPTSRSNEEYKVFIHQGVAIKWVYVTIGSGLYMI